jgi:hypothetical protein
MSVMVEQRPMVSRRGLFRGSLAAGVAASVPGFGALPSVAARPHDPNVPENLIPNPGFEEAEQGRPVHWTPFNAQSGDLALSSDEVVRSGALSVRVDDPSATLGVGLRSAFVDVVAGASYQGSVYSSNVEGRSHLYLEYWDGNGQRISFESQPNGQLGGWQKIRVAASAPDNATYATLLLYLDAANVGAAYFDDAELAESRPDDRIELFGPASLTAAVRGAAVIDDSIFITSRFNTPEEKMRLGEFDITTGERRSIDDLAIPSSGGSRVATDGRYLYIGPAGSAHVWRYDPHTKDLTAWAVVGSSGTWCYAMVVEDDHLYIGTYPDCMVRRVRLSDATVEAYGRISESNYATAVAVDGEHVYGGSAAPGTLLRWPKAGGTPTDLTPYLSDSPVGLLDLAVKDNTVYAASGREVISFRVDGSERVSREIPEEDRYIDRITIGGDGKVYALARPTTNLYEVTASGLSKVGQPLDDVENQHLESLPDGRLVGVSGLGHLWSAVPSGTASVWQTATRGFGYPEIVQSMLLHGRGDVWVAGHFAMTVHRPQRGESTRFDINGEAKSMAEGGDGTVYAGLYPSTQIVGIDPKNHHVSLVGTIGNEQLRARRMHYYRPLNQLIVATGPATTRHTGALTFIDLGTHAFDVHREYLPDQSVMDVVVSDGIAYIVGDTYGEGTSGPLRPTAQVAAVDIATRELLWREEIKSDWASYESVYVVGDTLYAMARRPRGAWFAFDLVDHTIVFEGDLGGYGQLNGFDERVFSWVHWTNDISELPTRPGDSTVTVHDNVPRGWYNNPMFCFRRNRKGTWGMYGTELALLPIDKRVSGHT